MCGFEMCTFFEQQMVNVDMYDMLILCISNYQTFFLISLIITL